MQEAETLRKPQTMSGGSRWPDTRTPEEASWDTISAARGKRLWKLSSPTFAEMGVDPRGH